MKILQKADDLDYAGVGLVPAKTVTVAAHTVKLTWQVDDGEVQAAELDLSDEHLAEYDQHMYVLIHAYRLNNTQPGPLAESHGIPLVAPPQEGAGIGVAKSYGQAVKKFADYYGITRLDGSGKPAYETPKGGFYKPGWLTKAYDYWVETGEVVLPRKALGDDHEGQEGDENLHSDRAAG